MSTYTTTSSTPLKSALKKPKMKTDDDHDVASSSSSSSSLPFTFRSLFVDKSSYRYIGDEFHLYHQHDLNVACHLFTTGLGVWGAIQLVSVLLAAADADAVYDQQDAYYTAVAVYAGLILLTTPIFWTAVLHTLFVYACVVYWPVQAIIIHTHAGLLGRIVEMTSLTPLIGRSLTIEPVAVCVLAIVAGYGLQDLSHWAFAEPTYMSSYMKSGKAYMLVIHTIWLMPLVIDAVVQRAFYLPALFVSRNRVVTCQVASRVAVAQLRQWIHENVPSVRVTTHVWPHAQPGTDPQTVALEHDPAIKAAFHRVFKAKHYDVEPIQAMNEIYVTAVGEQSKINSDAVFYTPHDDGPYWWLPFCSVYRVLVGITPNTMVRTRFNMQGASPERGGQPADCVVDMYDVLGFDYNRELHYIDHIPGAKNQERRSLMKLHYVVYPRGWHSYGRFCARLNTNYNTWARSNFLRTLRVSGVYEYLLAWWIWLMTWTNAVMELTFGWSNLVYCVAAFVIGGGSFTSTPFVYLTSFRHYCIYMTTFASRHPQVAHGNLMRDCKIYKTIALMHLGHKLLPYVELPRDIPGILLMMTGFTITMIATMRLGMVRTYFGTELGFVKPQWIHGFPYGYIPHPMIVGQLFAFGSVVWWWYNNGLSEDSDTLALLGTHMAFYTAHMFQEIVTGSY